MAESIDRAARPWDAESYADVSRYKLKVYRGVLMSTEKHRGLVDPPGAVQVNVGLPGETPTPAPALAPANSVSPGRRNAPRSCRLTTENLAAISAASPSLSRSAPPSSSASLSSLPSGRTPSLPHSGTPRRKGGVSLPPSGTPSREGGETLPPTPPTFPLSLPPSGAPSREGGETLPPTRRRFPQACRLPAPHSTRAVKSCCRPR